MSSPALLTLPAFAITPITSHTYSVNLDTQWCIGSVPHGGYVSSLFLCLSRTHFDTTHPKLNQPNAVTINLQFIRRTSEGPATFTVTDTKLGARTSVIHVVLSQMTDDGKVRPEVVAYITHSNFQTEEGATLETDFHVPSSLFPTPPPADHARLLKDKEDDNWALRDYQDFPKFRKASTHGLFYLPKQGQLQKPIVDEWLRFQPHGKPTGWTNEALGYLVDMFPQVPEAFYPREDKLPAKPGQAAPIARFWYPTLSINLEIKKALPAEGVTWLFQRVRAKKIQNGRMDYECTVGDENGEVIAVAAHTCLVMGVERNMGGRGKKKEADGSKL
jgi:hypothetical protein